MPFIEIIVDLGFGDAGKGLLTDFLARRSGASLVVRYNGGAQAGHNVMAPDGRHHTFSQFGSGTFVPGVRTFLARQVVVHPAALLAEGDILRGKGIPDAFARLRLSERALIITPFHQAANRIRELGRGVERHGSCGVGVGEAVEDAQAYPADAVLAGDLHRPAVLRRKLQRIRERKRAELAPVCRAAAPGSRLAWEACIFESEAVVDAWIASIARIAELGLVAPDEVLARWLGEAETAIFEGAQGVLLDADAGFHPYTTWSRCTAENAFDLIREMAPGAPVARIGVMRCYAVRHGPGPLPTETGAFSAAVSEHNQAGEWQGAVRYGWFDAVLARYALETTGGVDALLVTHLDVLARLEQWRYSPGYEDVQDWPGASGDADLTGGVLRRLCAARHLPLAQRALLTEALSRVKPILETCPAEERDMLRVIETLTGQPVSLVSRGPSAETVQIINAIPTQGKMPSEFSA